MTESTPSSSRAAKGEGTEPRDYGLPWLVWRRQSMPMAQNCLANVGGNFHRCCSVADDTRLFPSYIGGQDQLSWRSSAVQWPASLDIKDEDRWKPRDPCTYCDIDRSIIKARVKEDKSMSWIRRGGQQAWSTQQELSYPNLGSCRQLSSQDAESRRYSGFLHY